ncbi:TetR/AcrR family transcriptional regulator [Actinomadura monticuli]|uniref:Helix-turn-helix domain-containing protein n=1 Tax=Actinomadura monticuli TaxID=3097367 RepID=A0ABV4Q6R5_9ACTN
MSPGKRSAEATERLRASLVDHARTLIAREGADALTMRRLAAEAGCAVGLTYKLFADRRELVGEIVRAELALLREASDELLTRAGTEAVGANLMWYSEIVLDSPAVALARELLNDEALMQSVAASADHAGFGPTAFPRILTRYLTAEQETGRVAGPVDTDAFGFLIASTLHNLLIAGDAWPKPSRPELQRMLDAAAAAIAPRPKEDS